MEPCPPDKMNRSRFTQDGFAGLWFIWLAHSSYAAGALPRGSPGCPELAFWIASADKTLMELTAKLSIAFMILPPVNFLFKLF